METSEPKLERGCKFAASEVERLLANWPAPAFGAAKGEPSNDVSFSNR
jgi:hypothetical protein